MSAFNPIGATHKLWLSPVAAQGLNPKPKKPYWMPCTGIPDSYSSKSERVVCKIRIDAQDISDDSIIEALEKSGKCALKQIGFKGALYTIYACLKERYPEEDVVRKFFTLCKKGLITIERVGHQNEDPTKANLFIVVREALGTGGSHHSYLAVDPTGQDLCLLERIPGAPVAQTPHCKDPRLQTISVSYCMHEEKGLQIIPRGGITLEALLKDPALLTRENRQLIYKKLLKTIEGLHQLGYVHGDLKLDNVMVKLNSNGVVSDLLVIDLQGMTRINGPEPQRGNFPHASPERLMQLKLRGNPKDDVWAAMYMICEIERAASGKDPLLSSETLIQFQKYYDLQRKYACALRDPYTRASCAKAIFPLFGPHSLFQEEICRPNSLDVVMFEMARLDPKKRATATQAVQLLEETEEPAITAAMQVTIAQIQADWIAQHQKLSTLQDRIDEVKKNPSNRNFIELEKLEEKLSEQKLSLSDKLAILQDMRCFINELLSETNEQKQPLLDRCAAIEKEYIGSEQVVNECCLTLQPFFEAHLHRLLAQAEKAAHIQAQKLAEWEKTGGRLREIQDEQTALIELLEGLEMIERQITNSAVLTDVQKNALLQSCMERKKAFSLQQQQMQNLLVKFQSLSEPTQLSASELSERLDNALDQYEAHRRALYDLEEVFHALREDAVHLPRTHKILLGDITNQMNAVKTLLEDLEWCMDRIDELPENRRKKDLVTRCSDLQLWTGHCLEQFEDLLENQGDGPALF